MRARIIITAAIASLSPVSAAAQADGTALALGIGATTLTIDAEARRGAYPAGLYRLVATVRCVQP